MEIDADPAAGRKIPTQKQAIQRYLKQQAQKTLHSAQVRSNLARLTKVKTMQKISFSIENLNKIITDPRRSLPSLSYLIIGTRSSS
jgi:uncharacterized protein (DUF2236 family)